MDFFILKAISPEIGHTFLGGRGGVKRKFVLRRVSMRGRLGRADRRPVPPAVGPAGIRTANLQVCGGMHYHSTTACPGSYCSPYCLEPSLPPKKPKLGVSVCLPACPTHYVTECLPDKLTYWLTVSLSSRCTAEGNRITSKRGC